MSKRFCVQRTPEPNDTYETVEADHFSILDGALHLFDGEEGNFSTVILYAHGEWFTLVLGED